MDDRIELTDLGKFISVGNLDLSPDGKRIVFDVTFIDQAEDRYKSEIFLLDRSADTIHRLTNGQGHYSPKWSVNGRKIVFISKEEVSSFWSLSLDFPGHLSKIADIKGSVAYFEMGHDEKILYLYRSIPNGQQAIRIIDKIPFWYNGAGYTYDRPVQLWELDSMSGRRSRLVETEQDIYSAAYSNNGKHIAYVICSSEKNPLMSDIWIIDRDGSNRRKIGSGFVLDPNVSICWGPDNDCIALQGHRFERGYATHYDIWLLSTNGGFEPRPLTKDLASSPGNRLYCDILSPFGRQIPQKLIWVDNEIYFFLSEGGKVNLAKIDCSTGEVEKIEDERSGLYAYSIGDEVAIFTEAFLQKPVELWEKSLKKTERAKQLTNFNQDLARKSSSARIHHLKYEVSDGEHVEGWLMEPYDRKPDDAVPLIVWIHGGPKSMLGYGFMFEFQLYAANGFGVLFMNPRGSQGYSEDFADIRQHYGERDYEDIMEFIDRLIEQYPWIDRDRLGVTGISYGGFMTNWIVTQTDRFAAAVSEEGISDQISMFTTTDIGFYFDKDAVGGDPWNNLEAYIEKSPLLKASRVNTPIMFIHAMDDYRCWADQSIEFFTALKYLDKPTRLVLAPEGGHAFGWTGKPSYRLERLKQKLNWFQKYLRG